MERVRTDSKQSTQQAMFQQLLYIGFRQVGEWKLSHDGIVFTLNEEAQSKNILYAFVSDGEILYIGKTINSLKARMYGYQNPGLSQRTNIKNRDKIKEALGTGTAISIYVLPDHGLLYYGGFHLNMAAALEDSLVSQVKPKWNKLGT